MSYETTCSSFIDKSIKLKNNSIIVSKTKTAYAVSILDNLGHTRTHTQNV